MWNRWGCFLSSPIYLFSLSFPPPAHVCPIYQRRRTVPALSVAASIIPVELLRAAAGGWPAAPSASLAVSHVAGMILPPMFMGNPPVWIGPAPAVSGDDSIDADVAATSSGNVSTSGSSTSRRRDGGEQVGEGGKEAVN